MSKCLISFTFVALGLTGCSGAEAASPDPTNDVHCSVIFFYFSGLANHQGADQALRRELALRHQWQAARIRARYDGQAILQEAGPVLEVIKNDPDAVGDELEACVNRQNADANFQTFWRRSS